MITRLHGAILRSASPLVPGDLRAEWLREWRSELCYVPPSEATAFCLGAFPDALWIRQDNIRAVRFDSALSCSLLLALTAAVCLVLANNLLPILRHLANPRSPMPLELADLCQMTLLYTLVLLPINRYAMGRTPAHHQTRNGGRLRRALFFALKVALMQPIMLAAAVVGMLVARFVPWAGPVGMGAIWIFSSRWLILDQRRRCPVCLRLLTQPVRIGTPSQTLLAWYGAESMCSRGHGLLQDPETSTSYAGTSHWLELDASWTDLFSHPGGGRR